MIALVVAAGMLASEVLALVNGHPITRAEVRASLNDAQRQNYDDLAADLQDSEHAAVRDWLGRQALERDALRGNRLVPARAPGHGPTRRHDHPRQVFFEVLRRPQVI